MRSAAAGWLIGAGLMACQPLTTRPPYPPVPEAATTEVRLVPREATRLLAEALQRDSIPTSRVELRDAWLETSWFDTATGRRTNHRRIGPGVVRVHAWSDPTRPGFSKIIVETTYRPAADPSLPDRALDRQVPRDHPVAVKMRAALADLVKQYGGPPAPTAQPRAAPEAGEEAGPPAVEEESPADEAPPEEEPPADEAPPTEQVTP
jgi:hypothetical protein